MQSGGNVTQIESRAPFRIKTDGSPVRSIPCGLTLREVLVKQDSTERILKEFTHFDYSDTDVTGENFWLRIFIDEAAFKQSDFVIDLRNRQTVIIENEFEDRFYSQLEIGGILYKDVITEQILDELGTVRTSEWFGVLAGASVVASRWGYHTFKLTIEIHRHEQE